VEVERHPLYTRIYACARDLFEAGERIGRDSVGF
jgi:hypothetical protein